MASMSKSESESSSGASASAAQDVGQGTEIKDIHELRHERVLAFQFLYPSQISVDSNDSIYVNDLGNNRIQVISSEDGSAIRQISTVVKGDIRNIAGGVALDRDNNIMVVDCFNNCVNVFSQDGNLIRTFGGSDGPGALNWPVGIALSQRDRSVYVADSRNRRVQVFSCSGEHLRTIGYSDNLFVPYGIALDEDDNIYITDCDEERKTDSSHRVVVMSKNGDLIRSFDSSYSRLNRARSICVDQHRGLVIVGDNYGIQVFSKDGSFIRKLDDKMFQTSGLAVRANHRFKL